MSFETARPLLFSIAYRILSSVTEAEDAVQETWLRYDALTSKPDNLDAWLSTVVTRVSIDMLRAARVHREQYVGEWLPEPLLEDPYADPQRVRELADSVSMAALLLLERLSPLERAAFVLREVFGFGYPEVAATLERSEAACRQLVTRARAHMAAGRPRYETDHAERDALAGRFLEAIRDGDVDGLRSMLAADVQAVSDSGGKTPSVPRPIVGADKVVRLLARFIPALLKLGLVVESRQVNGQPGTMVRDADGRIINVWSLEIADGRIQVIRSVQNPDKLAHLGESADLWGLAADVRHSIGTDRP